MSVHTADWATMTIAEAQAQLVAPGERFEMESVDIGGVPTRAWKNGPKTLVDILRQGRTFGDLDFIVYNAQRVTFDAFHRATAHAAAGLIEIGVKPGDRVAIAMSNRPEWCAAFMAAVAVGAIAVPLNGWWTGPELAYALKDSGSSVLIADGPRMQRLADIDLAGVALVLVDDSPLGLQFSAWTTPVEHWGALPDLELPGIPILPEDRATIFYTSGTTGSPKGVLGSHRSAATIVLASANSGERLRRRGGHVPAPTGQRKQLLAVPLFHVTGCISRLLPALAGGSMLAMMHRWDAQKAVDLIRREGIQATGGVPTIALQLLDTVEAEHEPLPSMQSLSFGGAAAPAALVERMARVLPGVVPGCGFGMKEAASMITHHQGEEYVEAPDSCGPPVAVCDIRVVDETGAVLATNAIGELSVRGPNVFIGYWNREESTAEVLGGGWVRTGDLARIDEAGRCFIVDRIKDVVIRGGENIYCAEIEGVIAEIPGVIEVAVFGVPHATLGEVPMAAVQAHEGGVDEAAILEFVRARIAAFKVPARVIVSSEELPHNAAGKVIKSDLRMAHAEG
ncbi:MAG: 4-coumarate--CoA ligase-like 1 [Microbacteriaceae bacterium]|nr:4-coumarate--CoA ligase-like 1 [Microbacteriaceae bacterium]